MSQPSRTLAIKYNCIEQTSKSKRRQKTSIVVGAAAIAAAAAAAVVAAYDNDNAVLQRKRSLTAKDFGFGAKKTCHFSASSP